MSKLKLTLPGNEIPVDGKVVSFRAPCKCSAITCLQIDGVDYTLVDYNGNNIAGKEPYWTSGALISVTLDVTNHKAYLIGSAKSEEIDSLTPFTINLTVRNLSTDSPDITSDKTYEEVLEAHQSNKKILLKVYYPSNDMEGDSITAISEEYFVMGYLFGFLVNAGGMLNILILSPTAGWSVIIEEYVNYDQYSQHISNTSNPHKVTAKQTGAAITSAGTYTGTGVGGSSNPNTLQFYGTFKPNIIFIGGNNPRGTSFDSVILMRGANRATYLSSKNTVFYTWTVSWSDTSVSWYGDNSYVQFNESEETYYYVAIE